MSGAYLCQIMSRHSATRGTLKQSLLSRSVDVQVLKVRWLPRHVGTVGDRGLRRRRTNGCHLHHATSGRSVRPKGLYKRCVRSLCSMVRAHSTQCVSQARPASHPPCRNGINVLSM